MRRTYRVPHLFWTGAIVVLVLTAVIYIAFAAMALWTDLTWEGFLVFVAASVPLLVVAPLCILWANSGEVIMTDDGVITRHWGRERRLAYQDVIEVRERKWYFPPHLSLKGHDQTLRIHNQVEGYSEIYRTLSRKIPVLRRRVEGGFPYRLQTTERSLAFTVVGVLILLAFYLGIGLLPIWSELGKETPDFSPVLVRNAVIFFLMLSFFFLPALYAFVVGNITGSMVFGQPLAFEFTEREIRYRFPFGLWQKRPADTLQAVVLRDVAFNVRIPGAEGALARETLVSSHVVLAFTDGTTIGISLDRLRQFGVSPHELHARLARLYPNVESNEPSKVEGGVSPQAGGHVLRMTRLRFWNSVMGTAFFAACTVATLGITIVLLLGNDPGTDEKGTILLAGSVFTAVFLGLTALTFSSMFYPRQPLKLILEEGAVRFRYPLSSWREWSAEEIVGLEMRSVTKRRYRASGGSYTPINVTHQEVALEFRGGRTLTISQDRAKQFGLSPELVYQTFWEVYGARLDDQPAQ